LFTRICAIAFILICTSVGWIVLSGSILLRTTDSDSKLRSNVASTWGSPQEQRQPLAIVDRSGASKSGEAALTPTQLNAESSNVDVSVALENRQKGLLWYSTYTVDFAGRYNFRNPDDQPRWIRFQFPFPAQQAIYDGLTMKVDGNAQPFTSDKAGTSTEALVGPHQAVTLRTAYRSQGLEDWRYKFGDDVTQTRNFSLSLQTNFDDIDFPANTLSPTEKHRTREGWELIWHYSNLISGYEVGMAMPQKLQPGPLAGEICRFAPVSLLLFFFVMFILTTLRNIDLHPMNYFFLAAAFFAFHLLLAYLVDHVSLEWSFAFASLVSVGLVVSYLRLVVGPRFAILEAGGAQFLYLILFSYTFFLKGFTGLAITIGCILTLFVSMQLTARVRWSERFGSGFSLAPQRS
jgi:Inner membrane protein CreD